MGGQSSKVRKGDQPEVVHPWRQEAVVSSVSQPPSPGYYLYPATEESPQATLDPSANLDPALVKAAVKARRNAAACACHSCDDCGRASAIIAIAVYDWCINTSK